MKEWVEIYIMGSILIIFNNICVWLGDSQHALLLLIAMIVLANFIIGNIFKKREHNVLMKCRHALLDKIENGVENERVN